MQTPRNPPLRGPQKLAYVLLVTLLAVLWLAGGASRADALGQAVVRLAAWGAIVTAILAWPARDWSGVRPVAVLLALSAALVLLQLIPLPPALWRSLPGREALMLPLGDPGMALAWKPLTLSRAATLNALWSLVVPAAVLLLLAALPTHARRTLLGPLLLAVVAACLVGLFQFSGAQFDHPLINDQAGEVSGIFANRNHLALFAAIGIVLAPAYVLDKRRLGAWRAAAIAGIVILCLLIVLATGSRAGLVLGALAMPLAWFANRGELAALLRTAPRRAARAIIVSITAGTIALVALTLAFGRAQSIVRLQDEGAGDGLRGAIRPTVIEMIGTYFPFGSGFGAFDNAYRIHEPPELLNPRYVNLAHNDLLQVPLDGGILGAGLLAAALLWAAAASWRVWRKSSSTIGRTGSAVLFLTIVASAMDYPVRTPLVMAVTVIAAVWLAGSANPRTDSVQAS